MAIDYPEPNRRQALIGTVLIHGLLLLLFLFVHFTGPNPPLASPMVSGSGGVELNYGLDPVGAGDVQSMAPANASPNRADSRPPQASPEPQPRPVPTATPDPTPPSLEKIITSEAEESPVSQPPVVNPAPAREEVKPAPRPRRQVAVTFSPKGSPTGGGNGVNGSSNAPTGNSNGDDAPGTVGDKGDPRGTMGGVRYTGEPGSGGGDGGGEGDGFGNAGWAFDNKPVPPVVDNQGGVLRFKIKIDESGEIQSVQKVSGNMSAEQVQVCRNLIMEKLTVRKTRPQAGAATGFITFRFKDE